MKLPHTYFPRLPKTLVYLLMLIVLLQGVASTWFGWIGFLLYLSLLSLGFAWGHMVALYCTKRRSK